VSDDIKHCTVMEAKATGIPSGCSSAVCAFWSPGFYIRGAVMLSCQMSEQNLGSASECDLLGTCLSA